MLFVVKNSWALLFGMFLLMLGNGLQGTLLGVRGSIEGMSPQTMSWGPGSTSPRAVARSGLAAAPHGWGSACLLSSFTQVSPLWLLRGSTFARLVTGPQRPSNDSGSTDAEPSLNRFQVQVDRNAGATPHDSKE